MCEGGEGLIWPDRAFESLSVIISLSWPTVSHLPFQYLSSKKWRLLSHPIYSKSTQSVMGMGRIHQKLKMWDN